MAENAIVEKILEAAKSKGEELLHEAETQAAEKKRTEMARLDSEFDGSRSRALREIEQERAQQLSNARLDERRQLLNLKRKELDAVYEAAFVKASSGDAYRTYVEKQLGEHSQQGDEIIIPSVAGDEFLTQMKSIIDKHGLTVADRRGRFRAGFVLVRGDIRLNCSLDEEFEVLKATTERDVARILFGTGD